MIKISDDELLAAQVIQQNVQNAQRSLTLALSAHHAFIALLEHKYSAKFNPNTGLLEEVKNE